MRLTDLEPKFLRLEGERIFRNTRSLKTADGIRFLCPKCFEANGGPIGTHQVICWQPHVPATMSPGPGRWSFDGTGLRDLSLVAGSSSVKLEGGCGAHFWVRGGEVVPCGPNWT